jgi:hypothetical protein
MSSAVNFNHLVDWFDSANFAHCIGQSLDVINAWFQGFWVWSQPHHIPTSRSSHAGRMIFT